MLLSASRLRSNGRSRTALIQAGVRVVAVLALLAASIVLTPTATGATGDVGYEDQSFSGTSDPTGTKRAESVLWWNDGSWWADMWDTSSKDFHIFRLDLATQSWVDTGTTIDPRTNSRADVLWDGGHLYVASHLSVGSESAAVSGYPSYLDRFSYDAGSKTYTMDSGFPVLINDYKTETLVIDRDSTGKLWATWQQDNQIYVNRTVNGDDRTWGTPFGLPVAASNVATDDNSAIVAFGGNSIGLMWSNQTSANDAVRFAVHRDVDPDSTWQAARTAIQGPKTADDHINLKSLQADGSGRVYAAVKTSFTNSPQPLIMLLVRDTTTGDWANHPIARVSDCPNRPTVLIDEQNDVLHAFYTAPAPPGYSCNSSGGAIYEKTSPLEAITFPLGRGTPVIVDADSAYVHNASSTKQNVTSQTGIVVLARNSRTTRYWHHYEALPGSPPTPTPTATNGATPSPSPSPSPSPTNVATPSPSPSPSPSPTPSPTPTSNPTPNGDAVQRVAVSTVVNTATTTTVTVAAPAGTASGDVLVACLALNGGMVSGAPSGWTPIAAATALSNPKVYGYYRVAGASRARELCLASRQCGRQRCRHRALRRSLELGAARWIGEYGHRRRVDVRGPARGHDLSGWFDAGGLHRDQLERPERDHHLAARHDPSVGHRRQAARTGRSAATRSRRHRHAHLDVQRVAGMGGVAGRPARLNDRVAVGSIRDSGRSV